MLVFVKGLNWNNLRIWRYNLTLYSKIKNWFAHHLLSSSLWQNMYFLAFSTCHLSFSSPSDKEDELGGESKLFWDLFFHREKYLVTFCVKTFL
jgi:hypothetical protein